MVKKFVFDIGNVLSTFDSQQLVRTYIPDEEARQQLLSLLFPALWNKYDQGLIQEEEIIEIVVRQMPAFQKEIRLLMHHWAKQLKVHQKNLALVQSLEQEAYILSNLPQQAETELARQGIFKPVKDYLASWRVHLVKPDPAIYQVFLRKMGLTAEECFFIDDHLENVEAARKAGMSAVQLFNIDDLEQVLIEAGALFKTVPEMDADETKGS